MARNRCRFVELLAPILAACTALAPARAGAQQRASCETLTALTLPHVEIGRAVIDSSGSSGQVTGLPRFCLVHGEITPTTESSIQFEVWMPLDSWNGKFSGVGNGGWAGGISRVAPGQGGGLAEQIKRGYASASSNTGHRGGPPGFDAARFAREHPETYVDFAYRAQHEMTVAAKTIVTAFYGKPPAHSYYIGGSTGGYQGLSEAQRYPGDYDGIVAGAPANNWTRLMAADLDAVIAVVKDPASNLPASALATLHQAVLAACDSLDGVRDGVLTDPRRCSFDPARLRCPPSAASPGCLTTSQIAAAKHVYAGLKDPESGASLYPGLSPGSEVNWAIPFDPAAPFFIPISYFRWLVFADSTWDWRTFSFADVADYRVLQASEAKLAPIANATNPDLREFERRGGKLIQYHGWADQLISPENSIDYYESVVTLFGASAGKDAGLERVQRFYRLFMVPGLAHQQADADLQAALERWVERGVAPDSLTTGSGPGARLLCPYPQVGTYKGADKRSASPMFVCERSSTH